MKADPLARLSDASLVALTCDAGEWPRAFLGESLIPDAWTGLLQRRDGRRSVLAAGDAPRGSPGDRLLLVRNRPITVPLQLPETPAQDGVGVAGECDVLVRWEPREHDLAAMIALMHEPELTLQRLARAVADGGGRTALRDFVRERPAEALVRDDGREAFAVVLAQALRRMIFETGMSLVRVARLDFSSPALEQRVALDRQARQRLESIKAREMVEQAALAATRRRLDDLSGILDKLRTATARTSPDARDSGASPDGDRRNPPGRWHDVLAALTPADRGQLLENLWRIAPDERVARAIVVVLGNECVWLDPQNPDRITSRITLEADLGGLRSISAAAGDRLVIGAATGVWVVHAADGRVLHRLEVPDAGAQRTGFNAAAVSGNRLYATHSQLGCWSWPLIGIPQGVPLLKPVAGAPRSVRSVREVREGLVVFAADSTLHLYDESTQRFRSFDVPSRTGASQPSTAAPSAFAPAAGSAAAGAPAPLAAASSAAAGAGPSVGSSGSRSSTVTQPMATASGGASASTDASMSQSRGSPGSAAQQVGIHAVEVLGGTAYLGMSDGRVLRCSLEGHAPEWHTVYRGSEPVESIHPRLWNDLLELVIPAGMQGVFGVYPDQGIVARLLESSVPVRRVWAADDALVALADHRDRLVVMNSHSPDRHGRDVPLARLLGRSIQDACILTGQVQV